MNARRFGTRTVVALVAGLLCLPALGDAQAPEDEATLRIKEEAYVKGPKVYLDDLVEVEAPELKALIADVEVSSAARPGDSKSVSGTLVEARLEHAGINLDETNVQPPRSIRATTLHTEVSPEMLAASLRTYIQEKMPWDPELTEIDVPLPRRSLEAPEGDLLIDWRVSPQYDYVGPSNFRAEVTVDGQIYRTLALRASVETYQEIVVAATDISRGRPVSKAHLKKEMVALSRAPDGAITEMDDVVGMIARKTIFPNQPVTSRNVEARELVKRNQTVLVEVNTGSIHIQHQARAKMDGKAGDVIICANPVTKEEFQGVVRPDGVVEVR